MTEAKQFGFGFAETDVKKKTKTRKPLVTLRVKKSGKIQFPLSLERLYESDARLYGQPLQPRSRGECVGERAERRAGEKTCQHFRCRYNLLGELTRRKEEHAVEAMRARLEGEWTDSCAIDYADAVHARSNGDISAWASVDHSDSLVAKMLGVTNKKEWMRICNESKSRAKAAIERGEK